MTLIKIEPTFKKSVFEIEFFYNEETDLIEFNDYLLIFPNLFNIFNDKREIVIDINKITDITKSSTDEVRNIINSSFFLIKDYHGINLEDIYNTIVNDYYFSIKSNKWLFFEFDNGDNINVLIYMLNTLSVMVCDQL